MDRTVDNVFSRFMRILHHISDKPYQQRVWVRGEGPESDAFEEDEFDQLDQINQLVSFLAMEGAAVDEQLPIQMSIASLFRQDDIQYAFYDNSAKYGVVPCKSWYKK